jgi:hypothetical protein
MIPHENLETCICGYAYFTTQNTIYSHWHTCAKYKRTTINHRHDGVHNTIQSFHRTAGIQFSNQLGRENHLVMVFNFLTHQITQILHAPIL